MLAVTAPVAESMRTMRFGEQDVGVHGLADTLEFVQLRHRSAALRDVDLASPRKCPRIPVGQPR